MRLIMALIITAGFVAVMTQPTEAGRRRGPKKPVEHFTYDPGHMTEKLAEFRGEHDYVVVQNTGDVQIHAATPLCEMQWVQRRIIAWLGEPSEFPGVALRLPEQATIASAVLYLIDPGGSEARTIVEPELLVVEDTLWVRSPEPLGDTYIIEATANLSGENLVIHERVPFQERVPVLRAEYSFGVGKALLKKALAEGMSWVFRATTIPAGWEFRRGDTENLYRWFWRETMISPLGPDDPDQNARAIEINDYLPVPLLGKYGPDELPDLDSIESIERLEDKLRDAFALEEFEDVHYSGGGATARDDRRPSGMIGGGGKDGGR